MKFTPKRFGAWGAGILLTSSMMLFPATAGATPTQAPVLAHEGAPHCMVETGALNWGVKTSFRTYITGTIANGSWETTPGVEYIAPNLSASGSLDPLSDIFTWSQASGEIESTLDGGSIDFTGDLFFEGHGGSLELTVSNPAIEFDGSDAYLLLTLGDSDGGAPQQVRAGKLELTDALETQESQLTITEAPVRLTAEGAAGLNGTKGYGTYATGQEMDPLSLAAVISGCELGAVATTTTEPDAADNADAAEDGTDVSEVAEVTSESSVPWLPIIAGGVAAVVIIGAVTMLVRGNKKSGTPDQSE